MSHIPNSAMPHAKASQNSENSQQQGEQSGGLNIGAQAEKIADYAREHPKTAIAAGAAVVGAIAAAAIPLVRGRSGSSEDQSDNQSSGKGGDDSSRKGGKNNSSS